MPSTTPNAPRQNRKATLAAAREKARLEREARLRRQRRNRMLLRIGAPVLVVVLVVAIFAVVKLTKGSSSASSTGGSTTATSNAAADGLMSQIAALPASLYDTVGTGAKTTAPSAISGDALTADGKPRVLYIGAEYCPYCAAERWPLAVALSRFGTFAGVTTTHSSSTDVYPSTPTLSFYQATYTSDYLSFTAVETQSNQPAASGGYTPLQTPSAADQALLTKYDSAGSIPFVDIGNKYAVVGSAYVPDGLAGLTQAQIVASLSDASNANTKQIISAANVLTAALCEQTGNKPATVCSSSAVTAGAAVLPS